MAKRRAAKKTTRKKAPARKGARRKKPAARKASARKKALGRKKSARSKPARRKAARKPAPRPVAVPSLSAVESLARKIIRATTGDPAQTSLAELYAEGVTSTEASGETVTGFAGLEQKARQWEAMQEHTTWKPLNVFVSSDAICIEWDADVKLRDGRVANLRETAVHELKDGKIVAERYYYNPAALGPPQS